MKEIHRHGAAVLAAVALSTAGAIGINTAMQKPQRPPVVTQTGKAAVHEWGELTQAEIDALSASLAKFGRREVAIFCSNRDCDDLALDFDNAFETAGWRSEIERPLSDTNIGISVGPNDKDGQSLADAIRVATNGRISPELIAARLLGHHPGDEVPQERLALVISRKPR